MDTTALKPNRECKADVGQDLYQLIEELYPICRSITGNGVRETLQIIKKHIPLDIHEIATGTKVFDWTVPKEWNITDAYIIDPKGNKIVDFRENNLHVMGYSVPVHQKIGLSELKKHLYTLPDHPEWIPYRTSYYKEDWGFCLSHNLLESLPDGEYEVFIDSSLEEGGLTYGEFYVRGKVEDEVLISTHICHPSMCNDNLSGISVITHLAMYLYSRPRKYSYRFLFIPGTIGSISWLAFNERHTSFIKYGLVASLLGDPGEFTYKKSRRGNAEIDKVVEYVLKSLEMRHSIIDFFPYGYDERQYCSPGFNLPVGNLTRTPFGQFEEYHTSADNLEFVRPAHLLQSLDVYKSVINVIEQNRRFYNLNPKCEPQLGKRGLYNLTGGKNDTEQFQMACLWLLNLSDGANSILDIAIRSGVPFQMLVEAADLLEKASLLEEVAVRGMTVNLPTTHENTAGT